jgi:hypothetical protein
MPKPIRLNKDGRPRKPYTKRQKPVPTIPDPTDPGTLRPNDTPESTSGNCYNIRDWPQFSHEYHLPTSTDTKDPFAIWSLYMTTDILQVIVDNTNNNANFHYPARPLHRTSRQANWVPLRLGELYIWLAIYIYMGMHIENSRKDYWSYKEGMPDHSASVGRYMSYNRWILIWHNLRIIAPDPLPREKLDRYSEFQAVRMP